MSAKTTIIALNRHAEHLNHRPRVLRLRKNSGISTAGVGALSLILGGADLRHSNAKCNYIEPSRWQAQQFFVAHTMYPLLDKRLGRDISS